MLNKYTITQYLEAERCSTSAHDCCDTGTDGYLIAARPGAPPYVATRLDKIAGDKDAVFLVYNWISKGTDDA